MKKKEVEKQCELLLTKAERLLSDEIPAEHFDNAIYFCECVKNFYSLYLSIKIMPNGAWSTKGLGIKENARVATACFKKDTKFYTSLVKDKLCKQDER